ncbi:hypothetical protein [Polaribacter sp. Hel_I_88]|uniref:hypothetical protein n=1 Tax=Polaribacter sp. Hel_I_88 TaxID=1250006 RepID=UPI00047E142E|nr:hypothetical protein [Polaribacter sp. Hel_I_88]
MIDTFNIENTIQELPKEIIERKETPFDWYGIRWIPHYKESNFPIYYKSHYKNMYLRIIGDKLLVSNSLHKSYYGNNYMPFTLSQVFNAITLLDNALPINIYNSKINKLSAGVVINENPQKIFNEWQYFLGKNYTPMKDKNKIYGAKYFLTDYQIKGYDKTFEVKNHNQVNLKQPFFRFEIDNCKPKVLNNKTNNIGIYTVKDLLDKEKFSKLGEMILNKYIQIEKLPKLDLSTLSIKEKRLYASLTNYEVKESIRKQHPHMYKKDRKEYNKMMNNLDNSEFQNQVINKLKEQINYSINN